ncbi:unnamed protein product [Vitrella brassicaformis CCMP3155]|uniref:Protein kinase domain-containing protein n=1 Tax=Vitrella brassicaformis (strain CCMP3155) TaxID=1169540 RepID=A0A0G4H169_VITBC|nr:unnamed protein product [Vitrella brassicaformis CCMP3155]|eukprot:CEM37162.1 unnamed protein product [Vitrella brassicaformis CCMP3155]
MHRDGHRHPAAAAGGGSQNPYHPSHHHNANNAAHYGHNNQGCVPAAAGQGGQQAMGGGTGNVERSPTTDNSLNDICLEYPIEVLDEATEGFHAKYCLGAGAYGKVYKATLKGTECAIKQLQHPVEAGFEEEVRVLSKFRHPCLVILMGFARAKQGPYRYLVYEFMKGGDVGTRLQKGTKPLLWYQRIEIAVDACEGLHHLHNSHPKVYHRDIKTANILLDKNDGAKMADFGLAKISHGGEDCRVQQTAGTVGYADPLYIKRAVVTEHTEVYSFGMVLVELLTARPPATQRPGTKEVDYLVNEFNHDIDRLMCMLDRRAQWPLEFARKVANLALRCIMVPEDPRPSFSEILTELRAISDEATAFKERQEALSSLGHGPAATTTPYQGMPPLQPTHTPHSPMAPQHPAVLHHPAPVPPHPNVLRTPAFGNPNAPSIQQQPKGGMIQAANGYGGGHGSPQLQPQQPGGGGGGYGYAGGHSSPPLAPVAPPNHGFGGSPFQGHPAPSPPLQNLGFVDALAAHGGAMAADPSSAVSPMGQGVLVGGSSTQHHYPNQPLAASAHRGGGHDGHPSYGTGSPLQQPANPWPHMTPAIAQRGHEIDIDPLAGLGSVSSRPPFDQNAHRMPPQSHVDQLPRQQRPQNGLQGIGMGLGLGNPPQQQQTGVRASSPDDWLSPPGSAVPPFSPHGQPAGGGPMGDGLFDAPRGAVDMGVYGVGPPVPYVETGVRSGGSGGGMRTGSGGSGHGSQASGGMAATNDPDAMSADRSGYELFPRSEAPGGLFGRLGPAAGLPQPSHPPFPPRASPSPPLVPSPDAAQAPDLHPHPPPAIGAASSAADPNLLFGSWDNRLGGYGGQPEDHRTAAAATASESHRHVQGRRGLGSARREGRGAGGLFGGGQTFMDSRAVGRGGDWGAGGEGTPSHPSSTNDPQVPASYDDGYNGQQQQQPYSYHQYQEAAPPMNYMHLSRQPAAPAAACGYHGDGGGEAGGLDRLIGGEPLGDDGHYAYEEPQPQAQQLQQPENDDARRDREEEELRRALAESERTAKEDQVRQRRRQQEEEDLALQEEEEMRRAMEESMREEQQRRHSMQMHMQQQQLGRGQASGAPSSYQYQYDFLDHSTGQAAEGGSHPPPYSSSGTGGYGYGSATGGSGQPDRNDLLR